MSEVDPLLLDFAETDPAAFARVIAQSDTAAVDELLSALPSAQGAAVACRMPAGRISTLLGTDASRSRGWLEAASFEDAVALLSQVPKLQRLELVNGMQQRQRKRRLLQYLNYPAHSVGALVDEPLVLLTEETPIKDVLPELRGASEGEEQPAIVIDSLGRYHGVLDLWHLALTERPEGTVKDFLVSLPSLRAELPIKDAVSLPEWASRGWMPVVDHEDHVVGWVSRSRLFARAEEGEASMHAARESLLDVVSQMIRVMSDLLGRLLAPRGSR
ncbi:MAG: hypothetical protein R3E82_09910 [Pseudomonadales bacterium]|nr:hypothetical protein [Pseudomonadales bacterium]